jgi:tetratricopeptide (TPR) repeat protein
MKEFKDIYQLKKEFDKLPEGNNLEYIKFYENNIDSIDTIDINKDSEHFNAKLRLVCEYGLSLTRHGIMKSGLKVLEEAIKMHENSPYIERLELKDVNYYQTLLWNFAIGLNNINDYKRAEVQFKRLVEYYPKNEKYKAWLISIKSKKIQKIKNPLWFIFLIWFVLKFIVSDKLSPEFKIWNLVFGISLLTVIFLFDGYFYWIKRKLKKIK